VQNLTLFSLVRLAVKNLFLLILVAVVAAVAAFSYCNFLVTAKYTATGNLLVSNGGLTTSQIEEITENNTSDGSVSNTDLITSRNLVNITINFLKKETAIYKQLAEELGYENYKSLKAGFAFPEPEGSAIHLEASYTSTDPKESVKVLNTFLSMLPDYAKERLDNKLVLKPNLADTAGKTYPVTTRTTIIVTLVAVAITYLIILLIYSTNTIIQSDDDFAERFDIPVLGCIPDFAQAKNQNSYYYYYGRRGKKNVK